MEDFPDILDKDKLRELEEQEKIIYFRYSGNLDDFSKASEEAILKVLDGKEYAFAGNKLYMVSSAEFNEYSIRKNNFLEVKVSKKYIPFLKKLAAQRGYSEENIKKLFSDNGSQ